MIDWIDTKIQEVPRDVNVYLAIFEGQFCLISWWEDDGAFYMQWLPGQYDSDTKIRKEEEPKIEYWAHLVHPIDYKRQ